MLVLAALISLAAPADTAGAVVEPRPSTLLVGAPRRDEATSEATADGVARIVEAEARGALGGWKVVSFASVRATLDTAGELACLGDDELTAACATELGGALGADAILTLELGRVGSVRLLTLTLVDGRDAHVLAQEVRRIDADDDARLLDEAARGARAVIAPLGGGAVDTRAPPAPLGEVDALAWGAIGVGAAVIVASAAAQSFAVLSYHLPWAAGEASRDQARAWEQSWYLWHGLSVVGYAAGIGAVGLGVARLGAE